MISNYDIRKPEVSDVFRGYRTRILVENGLKNDCVINYIENYKIIPKESILTFYIKALNTSYFYLNHLVTRIPVNNFLSKII